MILLNVLSILKLLYLIFVKATLNLLKLSPYHSIKRWRLAWRTKRRKFERAIILNILIQKGLFILVIRDTWRQWLEYVLANFVEKEFCTCASSFHSSLARNWAHFKCPYLFSCPKIAICAYLISLIDELSWAGGTQERMWVNLMAIQGEFWVVLLSPQDHFA